MTETISAQAIDNLLKNLENIQNQLKEKIAQSNGDFERFYRHLNDITQNTSFFIISLKFTICDSRYMKNLFKELAKYENVKQLPEEVAQSLKIRQEYFIRAINRYFIFDLASCLESNIRNSYVNKNPDAIHSPKQKILNLIKKLQESNQKNRLKSTVSEELDDFIPFSRILQKFKTCNKRHNPGNLTFLKILQKYRNSAHNGMVYKGNNCEYLFNNRKIEFMDKKECIFYMSQIPEFLETSIKIIDNIKKEIQVEKCE